jgi:hypothetical protein
MAKNKRNGRVRGEIHTRYDRNGCLRTETTRRNPDFQVKIAARQDPTTGRLSVFIDTPDEESIELDGKSARTLYRVLRQHYVATGRSA